MSKLIALCTTNVLSTLLSFIANAQELNADFRPRPPEMVIDATTHQLSGPLKDIIDQAAKELGHSVTWNSVPFIRSLSNLKHGMTDIVPRVIRTSQREEFIRYVGPITRQVKNITFVTLTSGPRISTYDDLYNLTIGVKRGTAYFKRFDQDKRINKVVMNDDFNLSRLLKAKRIDAIIVLDESSLDAEFSSMGFKAYKQAKYIHANIISNYYGMPKNHPLAPAFNQKLSEMVENGEIKRIYKRYGIHLSD